MNIAASSQKFFAVAMFGLFPLAARASIEANMNCAGDFCWSATKHRSEQLKDYYFYVQPQAIKHLVMRYQDGAQINILIQDIPAGKCESSFIEVTAASSSFARGQGCLVTRQGDKAVRLDYEISAANVDQLLHKVAPVVWLSGYSQKGDFLPAASALLALEGK